jgi:putative addiction module component (TIGR02574 family)
MNPSTLPLDIGKLSLVERITFVEQIWDSIAAEAGPFPLTPQQQAELDQRLADHVANPDDVVTWDEVKQSLRDNCQRWQERV